MDPFSIFNTGEIFYADGDGGGGEETPEQKTQREADEAAAKEADEQARKAEEEEAKKNPDYWKEKAHKNAQEAKNLRDREKAAQTENAALKKEKEDREKNELSETERLKLEKKESDEKAAKATESAKKAHVKAAAATLGFANPDIAVRLIDLDKVKDDGVGVESLLKTMLEKEPYLKSNNKVTVPSTHGGNPSNSTDAQVDDQLVKEARSVFSALRGRSNPN